MQSFAAKGVGCHQAPDLTVSSTSARAPHVRGTHSPKDGYGWVGSQAAGPGPAHAGAQPPAPPGCHSYSEIQQHFQALPCLNPEGSALVR